MPHRNRSQQKNENARFSSTREEECAEECDQIAKRDCVVLLATPSGVFAEQEGRRWLVHKPIDQEKVWEETLIVLECEGWRLRRSDARPGAL
jgi:hypothetical protein